MDVTTSLLKALFGLSFLVPYAFAQNYTQCSDSGSDWYTSVVGETPCRTYERLRQICNSDYTLGALGPSTPPDTCNDQVADCCCNSIAFGLSMLCLTCQQGTGSSGNGIDAGSGAYQQYLTHGSTSFCTPNTNQSFTVDIQAAVCNNDLKIHDDFYNAVFWSDGAWFYTWSRERIELTNAEDRNNSFTHCASTTVNETSSSESQSPSQTALAKPTSISESTSLTTTSPSQTGSSSKTLSGGTIVGIAVGCIALIVAITLSLIWLFSYKRRRVAIEDSETSPRPFHIPSMPPASLSTPVYRSEDSALSTRTPAQSERRFGGKGRTTQQPPAYTE
ncbi:uncharacterized protein BT62DRAFT_932624 [Guyanagaster necrorhizus]|uniref:Mid2 domain-containing protein n=1 Tax=Guyanagaster necrorhizus TaxID=856835 RepID=A0A9P7VT85_9AGAR|nr:uncharacterized protein BT62DRAFT_932624 [Guyanagaster necrorhizus MCA 3950]KAG7445526.1 hypothetical protein BT62DRAFT_932624 [Guyanagaster necrorhizus MCA 3950]